MRCAPSGVLFSCRRLVASSSSFWISMPKAQHFFVFFYSSCGAHLDLHSFPTRRSSDLILWGLHKGERLDAIQITGLVIAVTGLVILVFPGLSAPPLIGSILMLGAGVAWGVYSLRGKGDRKSVV